MSAVLEDTWQGDDTTVGQIERELARLRDATVVEGGQPNLRTSVMTHLAWVPAEWQEMAEGVLAGMAERHPSRTLLLFPRPDEPDGLDARVSIRCFPVGDRAICGEVIELYLRGNRTVAPGSIVLPLVIADLPVFCRWRGEPPFDTAAFEQLIAIADRLIVDTTEWPEVRYDLIESLFERTAVSDLAWARLEPWRIELARYWPSIAYKEISVAGPPAEAELLRAWLGARLHRPTQPCEQSDSIVVMLAGERLPEPPDPAPSPSDLLSAELDQFDRDRVYEEAVHAAQQADVG